jgi:hypothetical protein
MAAAGKTAFLAPENRPMVARCAWCDWTAEGLAQQIIRTQSAHRERCARHPSRVRACDRCGTEFSPYRKSDKYCGDECRAEARAEQLRETQKKWRSGITDEQRERENERRRARYAAHQGGYRRQPRYTPEEDALILANELPDHVLAERLGRTRASISGRRHALKRKTAA